MEELIAKLAGLASDVDMNKWAQAEAIAQKLAQAGIDPSSLTDDQLLKVAEEVTQEEGGEEQKKKEETTPSEEKVSEYAFLGRVAGRAFIDELQKAAAMGLIPGFQPADIPQAGVLPDQEKVAALEQLNALIDAAYENLVG